jgi:hypothetical protein
MAAFQVITEAPAEIEALFVLIILPPLRFGKLAGTWLFSSRYSVYMSDGYKIVLYVYLALERAN